MYDHFKMIPRHTYGTSTGQLVMESGASLETSGWISKFGIFRHMARNKAMESNQINHRRSMDRKRMWTPKKGAND